MPGIERRRRRALPDRSIRRRAGASVQRRRLHFGGDIRHRRATGDEIGGCVRYRFVLAPIGNAVGAPISPRRFFF